MSKQVRKPVPMLSLNDAEEFAAMKAALKFDFPSIGLNSHHENICAFQAGFIEGRRAGRRAQRRVKS